MSAILPYDVASPREIMWGRSWNRLMSCFCDPRAIHVFPAESIHRTLCRALRAQIDPKRQSWRVVR